MTEQSKSDAERFAERVESERERWREYQKSRDGGPSETCGECGAGGDLSEIMDRGGIIRDLCPDCAADAAEI